MNLVKLIDVRNRQQVNEAFANLPNEFRNVDVLVNNSGLVIGMDHIDTVSPEAIDVMIDTNVKGLLNVTQAILPSMKRRGNGHIINISSIARTEAYLKGGIHPIFEGLSLSERPNTCTWVSKVWHANQNPRTGVKGPQTLNPNSAVP